MTDTVIQIDPEIQGGTPVFVGTRVPIKKNRGQVSLNSKPPCYISPTMSRPIRIEFPDALYHVTARGDRR